MVRPFANASTDPDGTLPNAEVTSTESSAAPSERAAISVALASDARAVSVTWARHSRRLPARSMEPTNSPLPGFVDRKAAPIAELF